MSKAVLVIEGLLPPLMEQLETHFEVIRLWKETDPERVIRERAKDIHAIVAALMPVRRNMIEALPNLEIISNWAVGYDNIDLEAARERGILVTNTPDVLTDDTADTALMLLLSVARRGVEGDAFVRAGLWRGGPLPLGRTLTGKKAGIIGLGRIGGAIADRLKAFKMDISYHGRNYREGVPYKFYPVLHDMARHVDFLVCACVGGAGTKHIVDYKILEALGPQGFLVNIARGSVVKEDDLLIALRNKTIAGAGLDVFDREPNVPEELFKMDNVVLTPHIGSATLETRTRMGQIVVDNLLAHFEGRPLLTPVAA